ncbi:hypothetical protein HC725_09500 [Vibrio sp. S17_S38]|uniref:hypothetical protein n=1 Tax=Vibrio sp. S17_S38 TaxID=2720229 RepID=UPI001680576D|nr:hypothetical protein [Vibrio sp. S17_S38]MBD1573510.1 hypothetical protein [Vibrio sp. S17_S38]
MIKQLLTTTFFCLSLSACYDSSSDSSPNEPLETLAFTSVVEAVSLARVETSNGQGSHLIGFDANGAPLGDLSNYDVDKFTPTSDGGFVVEVTENHKSTYQYQNLGDSVDQHEPITHTYRKPVWYYVQTSGSENGSINTGDYFLISDKKELPEFVGENSDGLLVFSDGETFNLKNYTRGQFYNSLELNTESIIDSITQITSESSSESITEVLAQLIENKTIEKAKSIHQISGDTLLSTSENLNDVLIETNKGATASFSQEICESEKLTNKQKITCKTVIIPAINSGIVSGLIGLDNKIKNLNGVSQILTVHNSDLTLLNTGLLKDNAELDESFSGGWIGETTLNSFNNKDLPTFILSNFFDKKACNDGNKQCLYSIQETGSINKTLTSDFVINSDTGFETDSKAGQIEGGQQNYLWVNDDYIVIKEARQISIIDRKDSNKLLAPILVGTEIDTINLTKDSKLYITATNSPNLPVAYIYDIATKKMGNDISNGEKFHALKALIK